MKVGQLFASIVGKRPDYLATWIAGPMGLLSLVFLVGSLFVQGWPQSVFIELAATFFGVLPTVFYVDRVVRRHQEQQWAGARRLATTRIKRVATRLLVAFSQHFPDPTRVEQFDVPPWFVKAQPAGEHLSAFSENIEWINFVRDELIPVMPQALAELSAEQRAVRLGDIEQDLQITHSRLVEIVVIFPAVLTASQLEHITALLDEIRAEGSLVALWKNGTPNFPFPNLTKILQHSLALITENDSR